MVLFPHNCVEIASIFADRKVFLLGSVQLALHFLGFHYMLANFDIKRLFGFKCKLTYLGFLLKTTGKLQ